MLLQKCFYLLLAFFLHHVAGNELDIAASGGGGELREREREREKERERER
jgi:hypothetical protein